MKLSISKEQTKKSTLNKIGIFSASLFVTACAVYIYSPVIGSHADESANLKVDTTVNPVSALTLDVSEVAFNITPTTSGIFESKPVTATVDTNSTGGYELYFSAVDGDTDMESLVTESVIASDFSGTVTSETMAANKWGYSLDNTDFSKIPTLASQTTIKNIDHYPTTVEKSTTVNIGMKIDTNLPSGTYMKDVVFSVLAHENPTYNVNKLVDLTSMQDMNLQQFCTDTYTPTKNSTTVTFDRLFSGDLVPRASLKDERDGKYYLVSKLADGNCWMSQNLALDLTSGKAIVASNNDGTTMSATPTYNTQTSTGIAWIIGENKWRSYKPKADESYFRNGLDMSDSPSGEGYEYDWEKAGNYYNWYAATAGTGLATQGTGEATASICPRGWRLPIKDNTEGQKTIRSIISAYDITQTSAGSAALRSTPLNFVEPGTYTYKGTSITNQGTDGIYWTSTAFPSYNNAHALHLGSYNTPEVSVSGTFKADGNSVRCVAI